MKIAAVEAYSEVKIQNNLMWNALWYKYNHAKNVSQETGVT